MSLAIDTVVTILNHKLSDGRQKLTAKFNPTHNSGVNLIMLFYTGDDPSPIALGRKSALAVYSREIECAVRHKEYTKAQDISHSAFELLGTKREQINVSLFLNESPSFKGIDERNGGNIFSFKFLARGKK